MMQRFRRRAQGDRGAVAVEAALVTPLILLIVFGIIEFTLLLKDAVAVTSAVRVGTRTASAEPRVPTFLDDTALAMTRTVQTLDKTGLEGVNGGNLYIYEAQKNGWPKGATDANFVCSSNCVIYNWNGTSFVKTSGTWDYKQINACAGDPGHTVVGVRLEYRHKFLTGLFGGGKTLADNSVQSFEPISTFDDPDNLCKP
jgi:Flp pilus assembly protein TadG